MKLSLETSGTMTNSRQHASARPPSHSVSESFKLRADSAAFWEAWVGSVLSRAGLYSTHHPFVVSQSTAAIQAHENTWDLDVSSEHPQKFGMDVRVEVKSLSHAFRTTTDYPYPTVLVCSQNNFIKKWPGSRVTGRDFLFVSRETGAILWLPSGSEVTMGQDTYDKSRNELYKTVTSYKSDLRGLSDFVDMVHGY